jgi:hypothetical protein
MPAKYCPAFIDGQDRGSRVPAEGKYFYGDDSIALWAKMENRRAKG